jgi:16S rRNA (adenine1518-N6/adenine1519-N6)-dimethyltransferase
MLRNTLAAYRGSVDFESLGFDLQRRAEDVPVAEYVQVARIVAASPARVRASTSNNAAAADDEH